MITMVNPFRKLYVAYRSWRDKPKLDWRPNDELFYTDEHGQSHVVIYEGEELGIGAPTERPGQLEERLGEEE